MNVYIFISQICYLRLYQKFTDLYVFIDYFNILLVTSKIRGDTQMINMLDGVFTEEDKKINKIFNVFCVISIENARLYKTSLDPTLQMHSFKDISTSLAQSSMIKKLF